MPEPACHRGEHRYLRSSDGRRVEAGLCLQWRAHPAGQSTAWHIQASADAVPTLAQTHEYLRADLNIASQYLYDFVWQSTIGVDVEKALLQRVIPVRVYADTRSDDLVEVFGFEHKAQEIARRTAALLSILDFELVYVLPDETGSWFGRWYARTRAFLRSDAVQEKLKLAEEAAKAQFLDKPQSEVTKNLCDALESVMRATKDVDDVLVQAGHLRVAKKRLPNGRSMAIVRTLSASELIHFEEQQRNFRAAPKILAEEFGELSTQPVAELAPPNAGETIDLDNLSEPEEGQS
jgi:hypothetical protein